MTLVKFSYPKGLDLASSSLPISLLMRRNPLRQGLTLMYIFHGLRVWVAMAPRLGPIIVFVPIPIVGWCAP